jgi:predicted nucleic acid-binding protein
VNGSGSTSTRPSIVLDASAVIRAVVGLQPDARRWLERGLHDAALTWPAHLYVEVAHPLTRLVRGGRIDAVRAIAAFSEVRGLPARVSPPRAIGAAIPIALERELSVYDAAYVVLAEGLDAPLVTADRRLAESTENAVLV